MESKWGFYKDRGYMSPELLQKKIKYYTKLFDYYNCDVSNMTSVEFGAGHGVYTEVFYNMFKNYTAIEPDEMLYNELERFTDITTGNYRCEDTPIDNSKQLSFVIFANSFQCTDFENCMKVVNSILKINGYLLILLPIKPFRTIDFEKNQRLRKNITKTISYITSMTNYELLFLDVHWGTSIFFFQKIE